jgi:hypothetical protein
MTVVHINRGGATTTLQGKKRSPLFPRLCFAAILLLGICIVGLAALRLNRAARQLHHDPKVGTVWVAGVTYGPKPMLRLGNSLLDWLNRHGIRAFGKTDTLVSRYSSGNGGLEIWFASRSSLHESPLLECHRVGKTAFSDDLGQDYQGYLDFHGSYVGIYLPGYDHAAHRLTCALHWMPRSPALPHPISAPMLFQIDLPPTPRLLPPANRLKTDAVQTKGDITITASGAHLEAPKFSTTPSSQRDLIFHLDVHGGALACSNVDGTFTHAGNIGDATQDESSSVQAQRLVAPWNARQLPHDAFEITDPYGISLLAPQEKIVPMLSLDATRCTRDRNGTVWIAPVNGGGQGTDAIRLHLYVQPADHTRSPVSFDLTLPVHAAGEI